MRRSKMGSLGAVLGLAIASSAAPGSAADSILKLRANAIDTGGVTVQGASPAGVGTLDIGIERWTSDAEHARLAAILAEKGTDSLLGELQKLPRAGYIRTPRSLGWDIHYARQITQADGSQRIVIATDRFMNFYELWNRPQSADYQYLLAEIRLGPDGRGQGTLVPAARIDYNAVTKTIEIENFSSQPVRLTEVRVEK